MADTGRPSKIHDPGVRRRILKGISLGMTYDLAANYGGISYETLRSWRQRGEEGESLYSEFLAQLKEAEGKALAKWLSTIDTASEDGSWQAAAWKAERRYPESYGRKIREMTGKGGEPLIPGSQVKIYMPDNSRRKDSRIPLEDRFNQLEQVPGGSGDPNADGNGDEP